MPRQEQTNYVDVLIQEMKNNEKQMKELLSNANLMSKTVDWPSVRKKVLASNADKELFNSMIANLVDVYSGIISNCAMFGAGCSLSAEFMGMASIGNNTDPSSLDWILSASNLQSREAIAEAELTMLLDSFADIADGATEGLKKSLVAAIGF